VFFKLRPLLYSFIFALVLEFFAFNPGHYFRVVVFLSAFSILVVWPLARKIRFLAIPFFLSVGSVNLLYLIDCPGDKQIFIFLSVAIYYLALLGAYRLKIYDCDQTALGMVHAATLATAFFWFVSNYGWYLNFQINSWILSGAFFGATFLIAWPSFHICLGYCQMLGKIKKEKKREESKPSTKEVQTEKTEKRCLKEILFLNLIFSMIMSEAVWAFSLWPFGYLTTGLAILIIFYVFWDAIRTWIQGEYSAKRVWASVIWAMLFLVLLLGTAQWKLIV
jgi:hypothetical protein